MSQLAFLGGPKTVTLDGTDCERWPIFTQEDEGALLEVFRRNAMSGTDITQQFEREFASWQGSRYALAFCNGTASLEAAMYAVGLGRGDELICPSITYWASCTQAYKFGATVVFADIDPYTLTIDPKEIEKRITPRTKAIMVVHYFAHPADMDPILAIAKKHGLKVIEDVSHATGALYKGRRVGTIGDVAAQSMMSGKSFAIGEGGMLTTDNREMYERAIQYAHYERSNDEYITTPSLKPFEGIALGGLKGRMNQCCAAVGRVQLKYYQQRIEEIQQAMHYFWDLLEGVPGLIAHRPPWENSTMGGWYCPHGIYDADALGGLSLAKFCAAVEAEGAFCAPGANRPLHTHNMFHTYDAFHEGKPTRIVNSAWDVRTGDESLPQANVVNARVFFIPWLKKLDKPYIEQLAAAYRKVALGCEELLADPQEFPTSDGKWHTSKIAGAK